jgi:hypothetical protein
MSLSRLLSHFYVISCNALANNLAPLIFPLIEVASSSSGQRQLGWFMFAFVTQLLQMLCLLTPFKMLQEAVSCIYFISGLKCRLLGPGSNDTLFESKLAPGTRHPVVDFASLFIVIRKRTSFHEIKLLVSLRIPELGLRRSLG